MSTKRKHTSRKRGLWVTLISLIAATSLLACGSNDDQDSASATVAGTGATNTDPPLTTDSEPPASTEVPATTAPEPDACFPFGTLVTLELNDRCVGATADDFGDEFDEALATLDYWVDQSCPDGAMVVAQPNEVLVTVTNAPELDDAVTQVITRIPGSTIDGDFGSGLAQVIDVPADLDVADVLALLPTLQGVGWSTDLNYLEPLQPNWGFRPADEPVPLAPGVQVPASVQAGGDRSILVLDSTDNTSLYDVDGNGKFDEDHGHGVFVKSIIQRQAAEAIVTLDGVTSTAQRLPSGRWTPMMFSDLDLVRAMEPHFGSGTGRGYVIDKSFAVVNLSLGGAGCTTSAFGHGVGERLALARAMDAFSQFDPNMRFVAAAGNDHGWAEKKEFKHFPAAWRDQTATAALAKQVDSFNGGDPTVGDEVRAIHLRLIDAMIAVAAGDGLEYTNCGDWINAVAQGTEIGTYGTGNAQWSGTSFATANESALVAAGEVPNDSLPCPQ